jgi:hypothetical protein
LTLCIELAHASDDVAWRADAHDLHDGLEDEQGEVGEVGMRGMGILEGAEHGVGGIVVRLRGHGDKVGGRG